MTTTMHASAREMRHMVGRYLHARKCPGYAVNAIRDAIMAAKAEGFDSVTYMEQMRELYPTAATNFAVTTNDVTVLDGRGTEAIMLAPAFIDELSLAFATGTTRVRVKNVPGIAMFSALHEYAAIRGVEYELTVEEQNAAVVTGLRVAPTPAEPVALAAGQAMARILLEGYEMDADQFWRLFHESNEALTPDSELSRRHAGSQLYDEDGNLLGEVSEETYLHLRSETSNNVQAVLA